MTGGISKLGKGSKYAAAFDKMEGVSQKHTRVALDKAPQAVVSLMLSTILAQERLCLHSLNLY